ncbi:hypothetical protein C8J56DRAFT_879560 [Mycena floridula]|nr:hypothetical protein C8J56DRAFT_879560 [Mycena floridula]
MGICHTCQLTSAHVSCQKKFSCCLIQPEGSERNWPGWKSWSYLRVGIWLSKISVKASLQFTGGDAFGAVQIKNGPMQAVFGEYAACTTQEAVEWKKYWTQLESWFEEKAGPPPLACFFQHSWRFALPAAPDSPGDAMDVDAPKAPDPLDALRDQGDAAKQRREIERNARKLNNVAPFRPRAKAGAKHDELLASLAIESEEPDETPQHNIKTYYYCIGCDERRANNSNPRALPHAKECSALARDFPTTWEEARIRCMALSMEGKSEGQSELPPVCQGKQKVDDPSHNRIPVKFGTNSGKQSKISDSFAPVNMNPSWQFRIDYFLLRFVICCAIAFSILDNGFFRDFVHVLCPSYPLPDCSNFFARLSMEAESVTSPTWARLLGVSEIQTSAKTALNGDIPVTAAQPGNQLAVSLCCSAESAPI